MYIDKTLTLWLLGICCGFSLVVACSSSIQAEERVAPIVDSAWRIKIRPRNYDPLDETAYMRASQDAARRRAADAQPPAPAPEFAAVAANTSAATGPSIYPNQPLYAAQSNAAQAQAKPDDRNGQTAVPASPEVLPPPVDPRILRQRYSQVYASIPFSRAEYESNPGYRQEMAMELLFGTLRPGMVSKQLTPHYTRYPEFYRFPIQRFGGYNKLDIQGTYPTAYGLPFGGGYNGFGGYGGYSN